MKIKEFIKIEGTGDEIHISGQFSLFNTGKKMKLDPIIGIAMENIPKGRIARLDLNNGKITKWKRKRK